MGLTGPKRTGHFHASFACIVLWFTAYGFRYLGQIRYTQ